MRTLNAWIENRRVGALTESPQTDGSTPYAFEYEAVTSKHIVSLTMVPIESEEKTELFGYMAGTATIHGDIIGPVEVEWEAMDESGAQAK